MGKIVIALLLPLFLSMNVFAEPPKGPQVDKFITRMVNSYQFDKADLTALLQQVDIKESVINAISKPAEGISWYKYRKIFLGDVRINEGVKFWQQHQTVLAKTAERYGVPEEIIVAIIGVETLYGQRTGGYRVIDALATLGFTYPARSAFFVKELEHFLILAREENMNPLAAMGSYAGAMGIPQFMPSSYRSYAADFEGDAQRNIWTNPADAVASVAYYLSRHHWQTGEPIVFKATVKGDSYKKALHKGLKPDLKVEQLAGFGIHIAATLKAQTAVKVLPFKQEKGEDIWVALHNFYVITRYNHSPLYAMAVWLLSEAIKARYVH